MIFLICIVALSAFLFGFLLGVINEPPTRPIEIKYGDNNNNYFEGLKKEYINFLTYDGSEQA